MDKFMELITFAFLVAIVNVGIRVSLGESTTTGSQSSIPTETPTSNISLTVNSTSSNSSILCNSTNSNCTDGSTINVNTTQLPKNLSTNTFTVAIAVNLSSICLSNSTRSLAVYCDGSKLNLTQICVKTNRNISINCVNFKQSIHLVSKPTSSSSVMSTSTNVSNGNHTLYLNSLGSAPTISVTVATQSLPVTPLAVASSVFKIGASTTTLSPSSVKQFVGTTSISEKSPTTSQISSTNFTTTETTTTESTTLQSTTAESKSTASKSTTSESSTLKSTTTQSTVSKSTASVSTASKSTTSKSTEVESTTLKLTTSESTTVKTNEVSTAETKTTKPTSETKPTTKPTTVATTLLQDGETTVATVEETTENQPKEVTVKTHSTKEPSTGKKSRETFKPSFESPEGKNAKEVKFFYVNVLIPIGAGVCGALAIAVAVVMFKCCRRRKLKKVRYFGKPTKHMMYMDQMNLLGDSSDEE